MSRTSTTPLTRARATSLPPDERRAAIIAATLPLLATHGGRVTTKQIAEAAGIAEGTIFRVFPDKESLIEATIESAFDPESTEAALLEIDLALPLEARLLAAVEILERRFTSVWQLIVAVGLSRPPDKRGPPPSLVALTALFEPDRDRLRRDPEVAAQLLRSLTLAGTHPALVAGEPLSPPDIVSVLLDGIRAESHHPQTDPQEPSC